ncbi:MAG: discoidin domain-containing protein [Anaerolineae bacterium]|nr:discoidin domain-containing protein [Anaerolineae bacterium]
MSTVHDIRLNPVDGGFRLSWVTDQAAVGEVAYGSLPDALTERAPAGNGSPAVFHQVTLVAPAPGAPLYFALVVDGATVYAGPDPAGNWPFKVYAGDPGRTLAAAIPVAEETKHGPVLGDPVSGPVPGGPPAESIPLAPDSPTACPPASCVAGRDVNRDFFVQVVERLNNVPFNNFAVDALQAWEPHENTSACWNPLATTLRMEEICDFNDAHVQHYQSQDMGVRATANTLNLGYYDAIRRMLKLEAFDREAVRTSLDTWGTCSGASCNALLDTWQTLWNSYTSDPDDNRAIGGGQTLNGTINPTNDTDTYTFDAVQGQQATLRMNKNNSGLDSYLILYAPNGAEVARNDDGGGDLNALINGATLPQTGRYRIVASSYGAYSSGAYTLRLDIGGGCADGQFRGEYFNNRSLSGSPTFARCDGSVNFDWGSGGPGNGLGSDNFSVRWVGRHNFAAGTWRFIARADDGVRVWLDGTLIIDGWRDQAPTEYRAERSLSAGLHEVKMEFYENGGGAVAQLRWESAGLTCSGQYKAEYWNNRSLSGNAVLTRCENWPLSWDWGGGSPGGGVPADNFSARWTGQASINVGSYVFIARADDGVRVWLDGSLIIDAWRDQAPTEYRTTRSVSGGQHTIRVEYYENGGGAVAQFHWEASSGGGGGGNLVLNRPASAWSQESSNYTPGRGNDGNNSTRWSSMISSSLGEQRWWADLGSRQTFSRVKINWETAYAARYRILFSDDGSTWYCYCDTYYTRSGSGWAEHSFTAVTFRYVGVQMLNRAPQMNNYSFYEFEVYNGAGLMMGAGEETTGPVTVLPLPQE